MLNETINQTITLLQEPATQCSYKIIDNIPVAGGILNKIGCTVTDWLVRFNLIYWFMLVVIIVMFLLFLKWLLTR